MTGTTYDGSLSLVVKGSRWVRSQRPPLTLTVIEKDDHLLVIPADQSGGLRGGDVTRTSVEVSDGGKVDWRPPSSGLYYPSVSRQGICRVETLLAVEAGSSLLWLPKVAIPCSGAIVEQSTELRIQTGGELLYWDSWADGRTSSGERGSFGSLSNRLDLILDGRLRFRERWLFEGRLASLNSDPAGFQGACQWHLGLALGATALRALQERAALWASAGETVELGELDEGLWIARVLCQRPRAI